MLSAQNNDSNATPSAGLLQGVRGVFMGVWNATIGIGAGAGRVLLAIVDALCHPITTITSIARTVAALIAGICVNVGRLLSAILDALCHPITTITRIARTVATLIRQGAIWTAQHPFRAAAIVLGAAAMLAVVFWAAPALSAALGVALLPGIGTTGAAILATAVGGALASGTRSLVVFITPMIVTQRWNGRQLGTDVTMSSTFGFFGFAQAAALTTITALLGVGGFPLFLINCVGLIGYEMVKDYLQNRIRNRVASDPKKFKDIWKETLAMNTLCNLHRCIPGLALATSFPAKVIADVLGTIWWDTIVNERNPPANGEAEETTDAEAADDNEAAAAMPAPNAGPSAVTGGFAWGAAHSSAG